MSVLFDILKGVGNAADLPGSSVRDIFARRNPFDQWMTPFGDQNRATGRDVLRTYGMAGEQDTGLNAAGGMATEMALDPLSWLGAGALFKALRGAGKAAGAVGTAGRAVQRTGLQQALAKSARPATAMSIASPVAGAYLMGDNEEGSGWKNAVGMGLMAAPLAMGGVAMAKGLKGSAKVGQAAASVDVPRQGPFYSRLEEALMGAPEKFETRPEAVRVTPGRTITHPQTGAVIKEIPEQRSVTPGATAYEQLQGYLKERAHPQEAEWVLGDQFKDQPAITRTALQEAFAKNKINLETQRHGGQTETIGYNAGLRNPEGGVRQVPGLHQSKDDAKVLARVAAENAAAQGRAIGSNPVVRAVTKREHGPLTFPDMLIPGGKNATEVPIRLGPKQSSNIEPHFVPGDTPAGGKWYMKTDGKVDWRRRWTDEEGIKQAIAAETHPMFPDSKGHFGDDVVAWTIHDQRTMPDGKKATFVQELQSDWHQQGAKEGYGVPPTRKEISDAIFRSEADQRVMIDKYGSVRTGMDMLEKIPRIADELDFSQRVKDLFHKTKLTPDAPFKGNEWTKLGIKQALADAIERGDDYVLFANPELVSKTQGMPLDKARKFYGEIVPNLVNEILKPHGVKLEKMPLPGVHEPMTYSVEVPGQATRNFSSEREALLFANAHYGKMSIPQRMPQQVYGFKIPDAMKRQAKTKGFPLMSVAPFAAAAGAGAISRILQDRREEGA